MAKEYFEIALFGYQWTDPSWDERLQKKMEQQVGAIYTDTSKDVDKLYEDFLATGEIRIYLCRSGSLATVCFKSPDPSRNVKGLSYTEQEPGYFVSTPDKKDGSYWIFYTRTSRIVRKSSASK